MEVWEGRRLIPMECGRSFFFLFRLYGGVLAFVYLWLVSKHSLFLVHCCVK
jgi:hypothetical protein